VLLGLLQILSSVWSNQPAEVVGSRFARLQSRYAASGVERKPSIPTPFHCGNRQGDRNFKRYFATVPSGMHPLGCGGHQHPPSRSCRPASGWPALSAAGRPQAWAAGAAGAALPGGLRCRGSGQVAAPSRNKAEPSTAPDCLQRPLVPRSRFRQQVSASVAMTSNVKSGPQFFYVCMIFLSSVHRKSRSQSDPTVDPAAIRGLATTVLASVGCLPLSRLECPLPASSRRRG
jgi:hypothetical protein